MSKMNGTLLVFVAGALAGGLAGILFAPDKGSETRRKIRKGAGELYSKGGKALGATAQAARTKAGELGNTARHQADALKVALSEGRDAYRRELQKEA